jgi:hypothetical protein
MNILILDDNEIIFTAPADYFVDPHDYRKDTVMQVSHPNFFWDEYYKMKWDEIWIDHDLGLPTYNGEDVTREIARRWFEGITFEEHFIVTTMNPVAAKRMMMDLRHFSAKAIPVSFMQDLGVHRGDLIRDRSATIRHNC